MPSNVENARNWMAEGDRLLGRAWESLRTPKNGVPAADLDLAEHYVSQATQAYLLGAVEYQQRSAGVANGEPAESSELIQRLDGRLRTEAEAALRATHRAGPAVGHDDESELVERARAVAEDLRARLAHAAPELFNRQVDTGVDRAHGSTPSR